MKISNWGCCEYAATPLKVQEDFIAKKKPFTYYVGEAEDHGTFEGIARLVYGDPKGWVQIFEANRGAVQKPSGIPFGTEILIPPRTRSLPKVRSAPLPPYPQEARAQHLSGDVVLDVALNDDGSVASVNVIDGAALLAEAAVDAVKQWQFAMPLVRKFVVVVSFKKNGKVQYLR